MEGYDADVTTVVGNYQLVGKMEFVNFANWNRFVPDGVLFITRWFVADLVVVKVVDLQLEVLLQNGPVINPEGAFGSCCEHQVFMNFDVDNVAINYRKLSKQLGSYFLVKNHIFAFRCADKKASGFLIISRSLILLNEIKVKRCIRFDLTMRCAEMFPF